MSRKNVTLRYNSHYFGTDSSGNVGIQNGTGVSSADDIHFGGSTSNIIIAQNVTNGRSGGIEFYAVTADNVTVRNNHLGIGADGNTDLGQIFGMNMGYGPSGANTNFTVQDNVISGNGQRGAQFSSVYDGLTLVGNIIGLNAAGDAALGNGTEGLFFDGASNISIGDGTAAGRNVIAGNTSHEISITDAGNLTLAGNYIGTDLSGNTAIHGDQYGWVVSNSSNITFGGPVVALFTVFHLQMTAMPRFQIRG